MFDGGNMDKRFGSEPVRRPGTMVFRRYQALPLPEPTDGFLEGFKGKEEALKEAARQHGWKLKEEPMDLQEEMKELMSIYTMSMEDIQRIEAGRKGSLIEFMREYLESYDAKKQLEKKMKDLQYKMDLDAGTEKEDEDEDE